jgi:hypothetical protein
MSDVVIDASAETTVSLKKTLCRWMVAIGSSQGDWKTREIRFRSCRVELGALRFAETDRNSVAGNWLKAATCTVNTSSSWICTVP